jgi:hypothetical protein
VAVASFTVPSTEQHGSVYPLGISIKNLGTVTETQVGYKVKATCVPSDDDSEDHEGGSGTCQGTVIFSAACTGTVGPLAPGQTKSVTGCTAKPTAAGDHWVYTLIVIHCGTDGSFPCTTNDGSKDANPTNNIATRKVTVT